MVGNSPEVLGRSHSEVADEAASERPGTAGRLESLLQHPAIWRGRSAAQVDTVSSGFAALDESLPGGGWPRAGLIEILITHIGVGELHVLLPALATLTRKASSRWCAWIAPPFEPYAPALAAHDVALERVFVARTEKPLWAFEQALVSGACEVVFAWVPSAPARDIRRLQLAAEKGRALGVLFRPQVAARESSSAVLRVLIEPRKGQHTTSNEPQTVRVTLLKSRGGSRSSIELSFPTEGALAQGSAGFAKSQEGSVTSLRPQSSDSPTGSL
jgi:cell division inhibitor SulA/protein ImuA